MSDGGYILKAPAIEFEGLISMDAAAINNSLGQTAKDVLGWNIQG